MAINTRAYIESYLQIKTKDAQIVPLKLNAGQCKLYDALAGQYREKKPMRAIVLKARQCGFSTLTEAMLFKRTATAHNTKSVIVAHKSEATANLYNMSRLFYERLPDAMRPSIRNVTAQELVFDTEDGIGMKSSIKCMTAGGDGIGRSDTIQNLHVSEYAFWPGDKAGTLMGLLSAVPDGLGTLVVIESTANGFDDLKSRWDAAVAGKSDFVPVFCGWNEIEEYTKPYDGFTLTKEEETLREAYHLNLEQLSWRRWCIANKCNGDMNLFHQEFPICPEEAFIASGACIFDKEAIVARLAAKDAPLRTGEMLYTAHGSEEDGIFWLDGIDFMPERSGCISIYAQPEDAVPYVIGADTAGEGSDYYAAHVLDNRTGEEVAVLHREKMDAELFTMQLMALGYYYNDALLAVETNFDTHPTRVMERFNYPALYIREVFDVDTRKWEKRHGFRTDTKTRPAILSALVTIVREHAEQIRDAATLREMLVFCKNERGKPEALSGEHDDLVLSLAIAHEARSQQEYTAAPAQKAQGAYENEFADDYTQEVNDFLEF